MLGVRFDHAEAAGHCPLVYKDPFDPMLVAQAAVEGLVLLTRDKTLAPYSSMVMAI